MNSLTKAITLASSVHNGQSRKGSGLPYITHPLSVMFRVRAAVEVSKEEYSLTTTEFLICAVLHDVYEDVDMKTFDMEGCCKYVGCAKKETVQELVLELFGKDVHMVVSELSNDKGKIAEMGKTEYLKEKLVKMSPEAFLIKCMDRMDNLEDSGQMKGPERVALYKNTQDIWKHVARTRPLSELESDLCSSITGMCFARLHGYAEVRL